MENIKKIEKENIKEKSKNTNFILEELFKNLDNNNIKLIKSNIIKIEKLIKKMETIIKNWEILFDNKENYNKIISLFKIIREKNEKYKNMENIKKYEIEPILIELNFVNTVLKSELKSKTKNFNYILIIKDFYEISEI